LLTALSKMQLKIFSLPMPQYFSDQGGGAATRLTADQLHSGSSPDLGLGHSGHSGGETPGPIPNPAVKPVHVSCGTEVRESPGTTIRCIDPSSFLSSSFTIQLAFFQCSTLSSLGVGPGGGRPPPVALPHEDILFIPSSVLRIRSRRGRANETILHLKEVGTSLSQIDR
jgi:hypothetical protein